MKFFSFESDTYTLCSWTVASAIAVLKSISVTMAHHEKGGGGGGGGYSIFKMVANCQVV